MLWWGERGGVKKPGRDPIPANIELPRRASGDEAHFVIENTQNRARDRPADSHWRIGRQMRPRRESRGEGRVFGRSISDDEMTGTEKTCRLGDMRGRHDVATRD